MYSNNRFLKKAVYYILLYASLFIAFFIMAFAAVLSLKTNLGISPWNVFHTGLINYLPITFGQANIFTGAALIIISCFLGVRPYIATFLNMIFIGSFIDLVYDWGVFLLIPDHYLVRMLILVLSVFLTAFGSAMYFAANLKYGPRDGLMMGLCKKTGVRVGVIRTIIEVSVVIIGWLMGGMFGVGTIIYSLTIGFFLELSMHVFNRIKKSRLFASFILNFHYWEDKPKPEPCKACGEGKPINSQ